MNKPDNKPVDRILGIDPGTNLMGYGLIHITNKRAELLTLGVLDLQKLDGHYAKLQRIFSRVLQLIDSYHPEELAVEAPFFGRNVQSMLKLGRAQGAAIAAALYRNLPVYEYSPRRIKQAITGNGAASKEQVAAFLANILKIKELPPQLDATDGLAAALCHHYQSVGLPQSPKKTAKSSRSWSDFIKQNPDRLID